MKRDDFGVRIDEIRELATKYSKPDLARMVQMGMIEPQKALMAGMMIDRIAKSAMQPPQSTVVQDVLGQQPTTEQSQMPPGIMAAPNAPPPSAGVAALPSGIPEMAGGGIVAFDEGGEVPGYADRGFVDSRNDPAMRIDPRVQAKRDEDRYLILAQELKDAQRRMERGDPRATEDVKALQREMRRIKPAPSADTGIGALFPSAQAAPVTPAAAAPAAAAAAAPEYFYQDPFGAPSATEGDLSLKQKIEPGKQYEPSLRGLMFGYERVKPSEEKPVTKAPPAAAPPSTFQAKTADERVAPSPAEREEPALVRPKAPEAQQIPVPKERTLEDEAADIQAAYKQLGVDTEMYKNQMKELEGKKAGLAKRKEQALGAALMSFGFDLASAREGQVFQQLNKAGQTALGQYMNSMDKIVDNEDKIDMLNRQLQMAENNFKRTGADSALTQMRARRDRIDQIEAKNTELRQRAAEHQSTIEANLYQVDVGAQSRKEVSQAQMLARIAAAGRVGALTQKQQFDIEQQLRTELEPKFREKYKNIGSDAQVDKKVQEELRKAISARIAEIQSQPAGYGGNAPSQDLFADWSVEGM